MAAALGEFQGLVRGVFRFWQDTGPRAACFVGLFRASAACFSGCLCRDIPSQTKVRYGAINGLYGGFDLGGVCRWLWRIAPYMPPGGAAAGGRGLGCIHQGGGLYRGRSGQKKTAPVFTRAAGSFILFHAIEKHHERESQDQQNIFQHGRPPY